jgi:SAM-dependent methyltransferase
VIATNKVLAGYAADAASLIEPFEAIPSARLFAPVERFLPQPPVRVLDIGAGTGRDAAWFASLGCHVVAVEPVAALREAGQRLHAGHSIEWSDAQLPELEGLAVSMQAFELVVLNGVLHHLPPAGQLVTLRTISRWLGPGGRVVLSLRHGPTPPSRPGYSIDTQTLVADLEKAGHRLCHLVTGLASHQAGNRRNGVTWDWLVYARE